MVVLIVGLDVIIVDLRVLWNNERDANAVKKDYYSTKHGGCNRETHENAGLKKKTYTYAWKKWEKNSTRTFKLKETVKSNIKDMRVTYKTVASIIPVSTTSRDSKSSCNAHLQHKK